jgi:tetratricopeptide (TPR) repeat protein
MKHLSRFAFLVLCSFNYAQPGFAQDSFSEGRAAYKAGNYHKAATCMRKAVEEDQSDPNRRYYLANSLANSGELGAAKQQYEMCVRLSPDSTAAKLSKAALSTVPRPYHHRNFDYSGLDFSYPGVVPVAQLPTPAVPSPVAGSPDGRHVRQMVNQIHNQVDDYKNTSQIRAQMNQPGQYGGRHSRHRDMAFLGSLSGRRGWSGGSGWAIESERQNQIEDTARSLEEMMLNNNGAVRLNPLGTNLYVRNYASGPSSIKSSPAEPAPIIELLAKQEKLVVDGKTAEHPVKSNGP